MTRLAAFSPEVIVSSPYPRAIETVEPLADHLGLVVTTHQDLRERKLEGQFVGSEWLVHVERSWSDFDYCLPAGESCRTCQARVLAALREIAARNTGRTVVVASHGNALGTVLRHIDASFGFTQSRAMRNPDVFQMSYDGERWEWTNQS